MSSISIVSLLRDYEVQDVKVHTFKLKHEDNKEIETFDVEKSDGITIEILFNTVLSFLDNVYKNGIYWSIDVLLLQQVFDW